MKYAEQTTVSSERSRAEIETILGRYGASSFAYMWQGTTALILFEYKEKRIKFMLRLPSRDDKAIKYTPERGTVRSRGAMWRNYDKSRKANGVIPDLRRRCGLMSKVHSHRKADLRALCIARRLQRRMHR